MFENIKSAIKKNETITKIGKIEKVLGITSTLTCTRKKWNWKSVLAPATQHTGSGSAVCSPVRWAMNNPKS